MKKAIKESVKRFAILVIVAIPIGIMVNTPKEYQALVLALIFTWYIIKPVWKELNTRKDKK